MALNNRTKSQANTVWLFDFIKQYWYVIIAIVIGYPILKGLYDKFQLSADEREFQKQENDLKIASQSPITRELELNKVTTNQDVHAIAEAVAVWLGTDKQTKDAPWYIWITDPFSNFEDEDAVVNELQKVKQTTTASLVVKAYYVITRRDLKADLKKYLSNLDLKKIPLFD